MPYLTHFLESHLSPPLYLFLSSIDDITLSPHLTVKLVSKILENVKLRNIVNHQGK